MSFKISGNFDSVMTHWTKQLEAASKIVEQTSRAQSEVILTMIGEGFEDETDPYGSAWEEKKTPDSRKVLHGESSRLRNGWHVEQTSRGGFTVAPSVDYAAYHQTGTGNMPARMMVPSASRGLPSDWAAELEAVALATMHAHFGDASTGTSPKHKRRTHSSGTGGSGPANTNAGGGVRGRAVARAAKMLKQLRSL